MGSNRADGGRSLFIKLKPCIFFCIRKGMTDHLENELNVYSDELYKNADWIMFCIERELIENMKLGRKQFIISIDTYCDFLVNKILGVCRHLDSWKKKEVIDILNHGFRADFEAKVKTRFPFLKKFKPVYDTATKVRIYYRDQLQVNFKTPMRLMNGTDKYIFMMVEL